LGFLGFSVSSNGIEVGSSKVEAIHNGPHQQRLDKYEVTTVLPVFVEGF
jgi:hypothetical protein